MSSVEDIQWMLLLKFGQKQHLEEFRTGMLHMNSEKYFAELEDDLVRADRFEGSDRIHQPDDIKEIRVKNNIDESVILIKSEDLAGPVLIGLGGRPICNLFCMFSLKAPVDGPVVDERNFEFGDSCVLVLNTPKFIDQVCHSANRAGLNCSYGLVKYYNDKTHSGETGLFSKPSSFSFQQEFRFVVDPGSRNPVRLQVGDLTDITTPILPLREINRLVDFSSKSAHEAGLA